MVNPVPKNLADVDVRGSLAGETLDNCEVNFLSAAWLGKIVFVFRNEILKLKVILIFETCAV